MPVKDSVVPHEEAVARAFRFYADNAQLVVLGDGVDSTNAGSCALHSYGECTLLQLIYCLCRV
jgi:hypothetical protein